MFETINKAMPPTHDGKQCSDVEQALSPPLASPERDASLLEPNNAKTKEMGDCCTMLNASRQSSVSTSSSMLQSPLGVSVSPIVCRICYSTCGQLFAFCKCKGSVGYVHKDCLKRWIDAKLKANRCEICQAPFSGTDWSFKPMSKWKCPRYGVIDKLYLALFICCSIIVLYSIPWISYKAWRSRDVIFGDGPVTSERIFALIVIAIYIPLNISCITSLVILWRRAVSAVCQRFLDTNKMWRVRVTREVAETRLINAVNSTVKTPTTNRRAGDNSDADSMTTTPLKTLESSPRRPGSSKLAKEVRPLTSLCEETVLVGGDASGDSSTMLIAPTTRNSKEATTSSITTSNNINSSADEPSPNVLIYNSASLSRLNASASSTTRSFGPTDV